MPFVVVQTRAQQIQDSEQPPYWKIGKVEKSPCLSNGLTDRHKMVTQFAPLERSDR